eukprot:scaffold21223_cov31-Tisochrysis_lutea.AAC.3
MVRFDPPLPSAALAVPVLHQSACRLGGRGEGGLERWAGHDGPGRARQASLPGREGESGSAVHAGPADMLCYRYRAWPGGQGVGSSSPTARNDLSKLTGSPQSRFVPTKTKERLAQQRY